MTKLGQLRTDKPIEWAIREIREWLDKIGIGGLELDVKYDARMNIALIKFKYKNKNSFCMSKKSAVSNKKILTDSTTTTTA